MNSGKRNNRINTELIFKYFNRKTSEKEAAMLSKWIEESEEHREMYRNARKLYEAYLMQAPVDLLEGKVSVTAGTTRRPRIFRSIVIAASGIAAAVAIFFGSLYITDSRYEQRLADTMNTIVIPAGKSMDYILPDGTSIKLNSGARLSYPMAFARNSREVHLDGEAYFDVAHKEEQPFTVRTFASDITVLGTKFNVKAERGKGIFSTSLVEGSVRLTSNLEPGKEMLMTPGQTVSLVDGVLTTENKSVRSATLWTEGILDVEADEFGELMEKLETAFGVQIIIERETMPELDFIQGKFRISDGIDCILQVLEDTIDFTYIKDYRTGTIHIR